MFYFRVHTTPSDWCDNVCQWLATGRWFSPVSSTNKTDHYDITEILLKVALNTIKQTNKHLLKSTYTSRSPVYALLIFLNTFMRSDILSHRGLAIVKTRDNSFFRTPTTSCITSLMALCVPWNKTFDVRTYIHVLYFYFHVNVQLHNIVIFIGCVSLICTHTRVHSILSFVIVLVSNGRKVHNKSSRLLFVVLCIAM
jgi:hypothetical protein